MRTLDVWLVPQDGGHVTAETRKDAGGLGWGVVVGR